MRHRPETTDIGWRAAKVAVLVVILSTLTGFTVLSHQFSSSRAGRIACISNQRSMQQALLFYQSENSGSSPEAMEALRSYYSDPVQSFGVCPADTGVTYAYDPGTGTVSCTNPGHGIAP